MKVQELIKDRVYIDNTDKKVPLRYTGNSTKGQHLNLIYYICEFKQVKTRENKNWFEDRKRYITLYEDQQNDRLTPQH